MQGVLGVLEVLGGYWRHSGGVGVLAVLRVLGFWGAGCCGGLPPSPAPHPPIAMATAGTIPGDIFSCWYCREGVGGSPGPWL